MFTFFLILLSFSIHILANPTPQNSNDVIVADSYLNAEPVDDSDSLNSPQNILVAGTNLVGSPSIGCTSDASTNEISDESVPAGGINRRQTACPVDYGSMPESLTQTGKEPAIEKKPSETPNGRCSDVKLKLYTCGGPIVGHPEYPWSGSTDPFNDKVLNCVPGSKEKIPKNSPFREAVIVAEFCCASDIGIPLGRVAQCVTLPGFPKLHHWNLNMFKAWARSVLEY